MLAEMRVRIWDVEHGACVTVQHVGASGERGRLAMIDCGSSDDWHPANHIAYVEGRSRLDYLFITNADRDHMSGLRGLADANVPITTLFRNRSYTAEDIRQIKLRSGPLGADAQRYVELCSSHNSPVIEPFDQCMGGITAAVFSNDYPRFVDTNNLSLAVFIKFGQFKILFPGDLEKEGWLALLTQRAFRAELADTNVLLASHHGRDSGFCPQVFDYFTPDCVVISDKPIMYETQQTVPDYRNVLRPCGVNIRFAGGLPYARGKRHVLTTRRDGWIEFRVTESRYTIDTEHVG